MEPEFSDLNEWVNVFQRILSMSYGFSYICELLVKFLRKNLRQMNDVMFLKCRIIYSSALTMRNPTVLLTKQIPNQRILDFKMQLALS